MPSFDEIQQAVELQRLTSGSNSELAAAQQETFIKRLCPPEEAIRSCDQSFIARRHFTTDNILVRPVINEVKEHGNIDIMHTSYLSNPSFRECTLGNTMLQCPETVMNYIDRGMIAPICSEADCIQLKLTVDAKKKIISRVARCLHLKLNPTQVLMIALDSLNVNYEFIAYKSNKYIFKNLVPYNGLYFDYNHTIIDKRLRKEQDIRLNYAAPNPILGERRLQLSLYLEAFLSDLSFLIVDRRSLTPSKELSKMLRPIKIAE